MSSSSEEGDAFFRVHAKAIAEALQEREAAEQAVASGSGTATKSQKERMIHDTYVALCHDDPQVESDLACQYLATALLDPESPYALSGPLVEGVRQLCSNQEAKQTTTQSAPPAAVAAEEKQSSKQDNEEEEEEEDNSTLLTASTTSSTPLGSSMLAWAIFARIPLLCCQTNNLSEVHPYLGSYRPPPPPTPLSEKEQKIDTLKEQLQGQDADRLAELLSRAPTVEEETAIAVEKKYDPNNSTNNIASPRNNDDLEEEVWADESDPSDFEFESGFSYEQQMADFQNQFAKWMIDRTDPIKLSKPTDNTTWKQVRHAVMDLISQLSYRQVAFLFTSSGARNLSSSLIGSGAPADLLTQFTMTLLVPPSSSDQRPSLYDSPDDEEDALQPQRQLQSMAWQPLWVLRDAAAAVLSVSTFSQYLTLLQMLISVDAAAVGSSQPLKVSKVMNPATYVGLASLSALCQQFMEEADQPLMKGNSTQQTLLERYRQLRITLFNTTDDLIHAMEQEDRIKKTAITTKTSDAIDTDSSSPLGSEWIVWTLLPYWEILTNQRLQNGTVIVAKAESAAQRHHQQSSQQWTALLQSGLLRQWILRLQALQPNQTTENSGDNSSKHHWLEQQLQWQLVRRSLLYLIAHSMTVTTALGKYAWRFPDFANLVQIGESFSRTSTSTQPEREELDSFSEECVDGILWNLLAMELAGNGKDAAPTIQWKSEKSKASKGPKAPPTREESQNVSLAGFQCLCRHVVQVLDLACEEENKKENKGIDSSAGEEKPNANARESYQREQKQKQLVLQSFHRFVNTLVACPLLAKVFVHDLEDATSTDISKCLDSIQVKLSQYKAPPTMTSEVDSQGGTVDDKEDLEKKQAKEHSGSASLQQDIHLVRKVLKMLRSLRSTKSAAGPPSAGTLMSQNVTSSSKTD